MSSTALIALVANKGKRVVHSIRYSSAQVVQLTRRYNMIERRDLSLRIWRGMSFINITRRRGVKFNRTNMRHLTMDDLFDVEWKPVAGKKGRGHPTYNLLCVSTWPSMDCDTTLVKLRTWTGVQLAGATNAFLHMSPRQKFTFFRPQSETPGLLSLSWIPGDMPALVRSLENVAPGK